MYSKTSKVMGKALFFLVLIAVIFFVAWLLVGCIVPTPTPTVEPTVAPTDVPTTEPTPTSTPAPLNFFYVSPIGSDDASGREGDPWLTIQHAVNSVGPGDRIYVQSGVYHESVLIPDGGSPDDLPIYLTGIGQEVWVDGGDDPAIEMYNASNWIIGDLTLTSDAEYTVQLSSWNCRYDADCEGATYIYLSLNMIYGGVFLWGHHLTLEGNELDGQSIAQHGVYAAYSHENVYTMNYIHGFRHSGIREQGINWNATIVRNTIDVTGPGWADLTLAIGMDGHSNVQWGHVIRENTVSSQGDCISLENVYDAVVEDNTLVGCDMIGIVALGYDACKEYEGYGSDESCFNAEFNIMVLNNVVEEGPWSDIVLYHAGGFFFSGNELLGEKECASIFDYPPMIRWDDTNTCAGEPYDFAGAFKAR